MDKFLGQKWFKHRRMITPAFHFKILDQFVEVFFEKCDVMVKRLESKCDGQTFDIYPYITRCALDIICGKHFQNIQLLILELTASLFQKLLWGCKLIVRLIRTLNM